jgi:hypothetical protein
MARASLSEAGKEGIECGKDDRLGEGRSMADPGNLQHREMRVTALHARDRLGKQDFASDAMHQKDGQVRKRAEQWPEVRNGSIKQFGDSGILHGPPTPVRARGVGEPGQFPPSLGVLDAEMGQHTPEMQRAGIDIGEMGRVRKKAANRLLANPADFRADVVQHDRREETGPCGGHGHRQNAAEAGPDHHHAFQVQRCGKVQHVDKACLRAVATYVAAPAGLPAPGIVECQDAAVLVEMGAKAGKIPAGAYEAGQAK